MEIIKSFSRQLRPLPRQRYDSIELDTPLMCDEECEHNEDEKILVATPQNRSRIHHCFSLVSTTTSAAVIFLIPSFLARSKEASVTKITETSYLNGVRGLASFLVYFQHIATEYGDWIHWGYHARPEDNYFVQLPYVRLLYSGRFMVAIFFILSGYVLSYKPLQLSRKRDGGLLFDNLASAVFRRAPRLFLPVLPIMFLTAMFGIYYGCYGNGRPSDGNCVLSQPSLWTQFIEMSKSFETMLNPFTWDEYYPLGVPQLWTLPMEFRGSMVVFMLVLCVGNVKAPVKIILLLSAAYGCFHYTRWDTWLFVCGIILAELRILRMNSPYTISTNPALLTTIKLLSSAFWASILALSLFIGSWPANAACSSPGFNHLCPYTPSQYSTPLLQQYFWISIAAIILLLSLENFEILQKPFTTPVANYFGDISFGLYIVHFPFLQTVGRYIIVKIIRCTGNSEFGYQQFPPGFFLGGILVTPIVIWIADVHWRLFDVTSVKFARWLTLKCFFAKQ